MEQIRQLADRRNREQLPIEILVVTTLTDMGPAKSALERIGLKDEPMNGVTYIGTPFQGSKVYSLAGILGPDGRPSGGRLPDSGAAASFGRFDISGEGITDPTVNKAWWYLVNGQYSLMPQVVQAAGRKNTVGEQATTLVERVTESFATRRAAITLPIADIANYRAAERLLADAEAARLRDGRELITELKKAIADAGKAPALADELRAQTALGRCLGLLFSNTLRERSQGMDALAQLAEALPETEGGRRAALRLRQYQAANAPR